MNYQNRGLGFIKRLQFKDIDINNTFFDSLREDYKEFNNWFNKKNEEPCFLIIEDNKYSGFMYIKLEDNSIPDNSVSPALPSGKAMKIGTLKIIPHGTLLGERFLKIAFDRAIDIGVEYLYVTVFNKHESLISLLEKYGFEKYGNKTNESVYIKYIPGQTQNDIYKDYPYINMQQSTNTYILGIYPEYHTRLFPDAILRTEDNKIIKDIASSNSIKKTYLSAARNANLLKYGDIICIYRTADKNSAEYSSVLTSICVVDKVSNINNFSNEAEFVGEYKKHSVFTEQELKEFYTNKKYPYIIDMTFNIHLKKRPIRKQLIDKGIIERDDRIVLVPIKKTNIKQILQLGGLNENIIIDKT